MQQKQTGSDLTGLEGKSLKKGTVTPWQCFTDVARDICDKHITKYLQKEGEILIEKKNLYFLLNCKEEIVFNFLISSYSV